MNEEKKVPFKWEYGEETISLQLGMYANNQRLYIGMITHINGFFEVDSNQEIDEKILEECMDQYEEMKE